MGYKLHLSLNNKKNIEYLYKISSLFFKTPVSLPKKRKIRVLIKSPHVFAKSKERYQTFVYSFILYIPNSFVLNYFLKLLPVDIEVIVHKISFF